MQFGGIVVEWSAILGFLGGLALVAVAIGFGPDVRSFLDWPSAVMVLGGAIGGTLIHSPFREIRKVPRLFLMVFRRFPYDATAVQERMVRLAEKARREGLLSLEDDAAEESDPFLRKAIELVVDGVEPEQVAEILDQDIQHLQERHAAGRAVFDAMTRLAPEFGMLGTLVGLIKMLRKLSDPTHIGPDMALALITTFYGAIVGYFLFQQASGRLKARTEAEVQYRQAVMTGILALQAGENPRLIRQRLLGYAPSREGWRRSWYPAAEVGTAPAPGPASQTVREAVSSGGTHN